jgi:hypothetical protein
MVLAFGQQKRMREEDTPGGELKLTVTLEQVSGVGGVPPLALSSAVHLTLLKAIPDPECASCATVLCCTSHKC